MSVVTRERAENGIVAATINDGGGAANVALISGSYPPRVCGIADYSASLAGALSALGVSATVWTRDGETSPAPGVSPVVSGWGRNGIRDLARRLKNARPGVVHLQYERAIYDHEPSIATLLPFLLRAARIPLVTTFHALDGPRGWGRAHRAALLPLVWGSRDLIVCSPRQRNALAKLPGVARKTHLIPIGTNIAPIGAPTRAGNVDALRFVYFGFVWKGRNIETLLRALAQTPPGATLDVVGGLRDEAYHADLLRLAETLGVTDRIRFRGDLAGGDVSRALFAADIALLPFATGVSPGRGTLMAALAHGLPVVTMGAPDNLTPDFVHDTNMLIAPVGDETAFIAQTLRVAGDAGLRARLARGASELAPRFAWDAIARQTLALPAYRAVAKGSARA